MPNTSNSNDLSISEALSQAYAHWNAGQANQAEQLCQRVLSVWPGQADALHLLGLMAHAYHNLDLAIEHLRSACQAPRTPPMYLSNLAEMLRQKGLLVEAERAARRALTIDKQSPAIWNNLGIILQEAGKFDESRRCLEKLLTLQPDNPEAHNNLANTYKRLNMLPLANKHWLRALELKPEYAEVHSNLANLYNDLAQYDLAVEHGRKAIELNPVLADAYINLAAIETARHRHTEALRWLDALISFDPTHVTGLAARGLSLVQLGMPEMALETVKIALEHAPEHSEALNTQGLILQELGNASAAEQSFRSALTRADINQEKITINLANLFMQEGRVSEASAAFEQVLQRYPRSAAAWFNRSDLVHFKKGDTDIKKMLAALNQTPSLSDADKRLRHFALGKAYLDMHESVLAFQHLNLGNQFKRKTFTFDIQTTREWMKQIAQTFSVEFIQTLQSSQRNVPIGKAPIFVLGMPRSGTSLIEQILASHKLIHGAGELKLVQRLVDTLQGYPTSAPPLTKAHIDRLGQTYLEKIQPLTQGRPYLVDKMPANFLHAGLIHMMLPEARIIHCRRNPVDTCLSLYSKLFSDQQLFAYDLTELGQFYLCYAELTDHWRTVIPSTHFLDVDYELVTEDIECQARRMLDFVGIEWDPSCLDFHKTQRTVKTASMNQVRQPVYQGSKGRWRQYASQLGPLLTALGTRAHDSVAPTEP